MNEWIIISIALVVILVLIGILLTLVVYKKKKEGKIEEPNYQAFFIMGISFLAMGIALSAAVGPASLGFVGMGIIYMAIGLANRDKWKKKEELKNG